jgi:UDP-GlcNAc:undecaprenyl-phosphate GlcNAc-1-phosphate transferase
LYWLVPRALAILAVAAGASWLLTPPAARLGVKLGLVDNPSSRRVKARPVPTSGGLVVFGAFVASMVAMLLLHQAAPGVLANKITALLLGGTAVLVLGMADDKHVLPAWVKLLVQMGVATAMVFAGVGIERVHIPMGPMIQLGWWSYPLTVLWFVGFMNALNLIDGLDGLASGIVAITSGTMLLIGFMEDAPVLAFMCASLLGSTIGFLLHNFPKGDVYLGDAGSTVLGFFLAGAATIGASNDAASKSLLIAAACMAVPAFDVATSIARRWRSRQGIMTADRSHVHHRLIRFGLSPRMAVLVLWGTTVFFAGQMLGLLARFGFLYTLGSYAVAGFVLNALRLQRRKNIKTTGRDLKDEVFYLLGATDSVDDEPEGDDAGLRQLIMNQLRREVKYRKIVREENGGREERRSPAERGGAPAADRAVPESRKTPASADRAAETVPDDSDRPVEPVGARDEDAR